MARSSTKHLKLKIKDSKDKLKSIGQRMEESKLTDVIIQEYNVEAAKLGDLQTKLKYLEKGTHRKTYMEIMPIP